MHHPRSAALLAAVAALAALLSAAAWADAPAGPLAVIMSRNAPLDAIGLHDLSRVFLDQIQSAGGVALIPVNLTSSHPAREAFIRAVHGMTLFEMKQYWLSVRLKGQGRPPVAYETADAVKAAVKSGDAVIGYLPYEPGLETEFKCLAIDGKRPGEPGYPL